MKAHLLLYNIIQLFILFKIYYQRCSYFNHFKIITKIETLRRFCSQRIQHLHIDYSKRFFRFLNGKWMYNILCFILYQNSFCQFLLIIILEIFLIDNELLKIRKLLLLTSTYCKKLEGVQEKLWKKHPPLMNRKKMLFLQDKTHVVKRQ